MAAGNIEARLKALERAVLPPPMADQIIYTVNIGSKTDPVKSWNGITAQPGEDSDTHLQRAKTLLVQSSRARGQGVTFLVAEGAS